MRKSIVAVMFVSALALGCQRNDMWEQPRVNTFSANSFFTDGQSARMPVQGTVARGNLQEDDLLYRGLENGKMTSVFPMKVTKEMLEHGMDRYNIFCSPCHGKSGDGLGMIVQRGFKQPVSLHDERLWKASPGYYYAVLERGYSALAKEGLAPATNTETDYVHPAISKKMDVNDRWAIIAFIRALQRSQRATIGDIPEAERDAVLNPKKEEHSGGH